MKIARVIGFVLLAIEWRPRAIFLRYNPTVSLDDMADRS